MSFHLIPSFIWDLLCNLGHEFCIVPMVYFSISAPATHCNFLLAFIKPWHLLEQVTSTYFRNVCLGLTPDINFTISWMNSNKNSDEILTGIAFESIDQLGDQGHILSFYFILPFMCQYSLIFHTGSYKS